jgi:hypothetical protein
MWLVHKAEAAGWFAYEVVLAVVRKTFVFNLLVDCPAC